MFDKTAGETIVETLLEWDIDHIYGLPGDSINNLIEDLRKSKDRIEFLQVRHEEVGALAASSYAKLTGKIGVCLSIAGPGAVHLMNGLYDAKADGAPVLVLAGQVESEKLGMDDFQEIKLDRMFDDVSVFNQTVTNPDQMPDLLNQAIRTAYAEKGVAVLTIPDDIPNQKVRNKTKQTSTVRTVSRVIPGASDLKKSLTLIKDSKSPVILVGNGARHARSELEQFAVNIAAPMIVTLPAKGVIPDEHPYNLGNLGQIGTKPAYEAMEETDLLVMVGTSFPYRDFLPEDVPAIQIDLDPKQIGKRYPVDVGLVGDSKGTLDWLNSNLDRSEDRGFLEACQENMQNWWENLHKEEMERTTPLKPQQVVPKLHQLIEDDAIVSVDVGNVTVWMARYFRMTNQRLVISSWMATMGCGLPGAIAAKKADPSKQVVTVCGDGGFTMVMHDFVTAVKYDMPIIVVILNNEKIGMIKYEQQEIGHLEYETNLKTIDFARFAEACGGVGYRVENHDELDHAIENAKGSNRPVIIDVMIEDEPPLPGKIQYGQAASYSKYLVKKFFEKGEFDMPPLKKSLKRLT